MAHFNKDCNEYLKTRKGLHSLIETYGNDDTCTVEQAVRQEHLLWGWPLYD